MSVTAVPANPCFWSKSAKHDVTLTSLTAGLSGPRSIFFTKVCRIDAREGTESLAALRAAVFSLSQKKREGGYKYDKKFKKWLFGQQ